MNDCSDWQEMLQLVCLLLLNQTNLKKSKWNVISFKVFSSSELHSYSFDSSYRLETRGSTPLKLSVKKSYECGVQMTETINR